MNTQTKNSWKRKKWLIAPLIIGGIALLIWVLMLLWNAILPDVLGVNEVTYWQAFGIFILSKILFGGFKGGGGKHKKRRFDQRKRQHYKEKFMNMTDEQKAAFRSEWKARCD